MNTRLKTTSLHQWHKDAGANMADFGGFDMPLWYETGVKNEHLAVLKSAGIFDTSHMACINVKGNDSFGLLDYCFTRDLSKAGYGTITTEIRDTAPFYYAEDYHQQYLAKNPGGYCGLGGTGVSCQGGTA